MSYNQGAGSWYAWAFSTGASIGEAAGKRKLQKAQRAHGDAMVRLASSARQSRNSMAYAQADMARDAAVENVRRLATSGESQVDALNLNVARQERARGLQSLASAIQDAEAQGHAQARAWAEGSAGSAGVAVQNALLLKQNIEKQERDTEAQEASGDADAAKRNLRTQIAQQGRSVSDYPDLDFGVDVNQAPAADSWGSVLGAWAASTDWKQGYTLYKSKDE